MLSPAFNIVASVLARAEAEREMDLKEMEMMDPDGDAQRELNEDDTSLMSKNSSFTATLKRFSAEVPILNNRKYKGFFNDFIKKEIFRRHEELTVVSETLQVAVQTAMTLKLSPASNYLLTFTTLKELADESIANSLSLSVEDLAVVQSMFGGGDSSSLSSVANSSLPSTPSLSSGLGRPSNSLPKQFFDSTAPHNNVFSIIANRLKKDGNSPTSSASSLPLAGSSKAQDNFIDVLGKYLIEDSEIDEDFKTANFEGEDQSRGEGMQSYLESLRRKWSCLFLVWGRWSTAMALVTNSTGSSSAVSHVNIVELIMKYLTGSVYPSFDLALQQAAERASGSALDSGKGSRRNSPTPPQVTTASKESSTPNPRNLKEKGASMGNSKTAQQTINKWGTKWDDFNAKTLKQVVMIQSLWRGWRARRHLFPQQVQKTAPSPHEKAKYFHKVRHSQLYKGILSAYREQQPTLIAYLQTTAQMMTDEAKAEEFFSTEETIFNKQFKEWSAKMTKYYLEEAPLDADWAVQKTPVPPDMDRNANDQHSNRSEFIDPATGQRFLRSFVNIKTGKVQDENPNMLKVIATKNRQLLKAQKARSDRINEMNLFVDHINGTKRQLIPQLEGALSVPVYI